MKKYMLTLLTMLFVACSSDGGTQAETLQTENDMKMYITIAGQTQSVVLANNAATQELVTRLHNGAVTVTLNSSGGFEIWGPLGFSLPTSNQQMMAQPGDVVLYNGSNICLFYGSNSWSYTRLGKIEGLSESQLRTFLKAGESNITVTLSLTSAATGISDVSNNRQNTTGSESLAYMLSGAPAPASYKGIVIKDGKKILVK